MEAYWNSNLTAEERTEDLLGRMTLKEKVGQVNQRMYGWHAYRRTPDGIELTEAFKREVAFGDGMGALYGLFRADPWSAVTYGNGIPAADSAKAANRIQRYVREHTRLGIPVLLSEECPHGHQALDGTLIPTNIGIGSTWNPELMERVYSFVAAEIRARGAHIGLISTLDVLRDPRWGRSEECYSEDPYLAARLTEAAVRGLQGHTPEELRRPDKIAALLKHFCAQGAAEGGRNAAPAAIGERALREIHLPGMLAGVRAGARGCMAAYNEIDGIPCHANKRLLTGILREEWGFDGVVMADGQAVDRLVQMTGDHESAAALALSAGIDLSLWDKAFTTLEAAVKAGKADEAQLDRAVRRILRLKFELGLFDKPYTDESAAPHAVGSEAFRLHNLQAARESVVLLKNEDRQLPLGPRYRKIAVIGPNADSIYNQLGDYTSTQPPGKGVTVLEGVRRAAPPGTEVVYAAGSGIRSGTPEMIQEALSVAADADVIVLVLGGSSARNFDIRFDTNGAAIIGEGSPGEMDCGEGVDLADLRIGEPQRLLAQAISAAGIPVVGVAIQGRPHALTDIEPLCGALLCAWYPGQEGGLAIGDVLFGKTNPSGKLPVSLPRSSGQLPVYYNSKDAGRPGYIDQTREPLYPFGHGLSYTSFEFDGLRLEPAAISLQELESGRRVAVSVNVRNTGDTAGAEVVQLYIKDLEASVTRPAAELKGFRKTMLEPGETKTIVLELGWEQLALWNRDMVFTPEPGRVQLTVGGSLAGACTAELILTGNQ
ncbi:glycoside hydrolase family 3 N-terminal domain-containing protein [Paenibacillus humicola]|uniref:glycoside hydrolase family 3 N-terminal domain-containing protein n=1 Tax=Paenibacillus humicola TaxID=3110540 RepID=UPI00237AF4B2|nr:glycoside hydrolase family 3 N-terminal domain-containing protein [Paenibacillus humicola]